MNAVEAETAERVIERGAADLGIDLEAARRMVIRWAKRQY
jgi:sugar diacid utilization regulator